MIKLKEIEFDNYLLREVKVDDYIDYYDIGIDEENVRFLSWEPYKNMDEAKEHFTYIYFDDDFKDDPNGYAIVDKTTNKMIGVIDFHSYDKKKKEAHIGYLLHKSYWNLGIITKAIKYLIEIGFNDLNLNKIIIQTIKENYSSIRVAEKADFKLVSIKKGAYYHEKTNSFHDLYKYELKRKCYNDSKTKRNI